MAAGWRERLETDYLVKHPNETIAGLACDIRCALAELDRLSAALAESGADVDGSWGHHTGQNERNTLLLSALAEAEGALEPFKAAAELIPADREDFHVVAHVPGGPNADAFRRMAENLTAGNFRRAASALATLMVIALGGCDILRGLSQDPHAPIQPTTKCVGVACAIHPIPAKSAGR